MKLMSYGDPDMGQKWKRLRWVQETARSLDEAVYPHDSDVPGLTFLSPVEWAPWMETIWFGNQYDYRSAYFHDVMYSNNKPCREGALLFSDRHKAQEMALLYQRYKKFDMASYSVPNATFFNVFGAETLRVGRYKVRILLYYCPSFPFLFVVSLSFSPSLLSISCSLLAFSDTT
jgi:hypothetical protein